MKRSGRAPSSRGKHLIHSLLRLPLVSLAGLLATPDLVAAQSYDRPEIVRGLCSKDGCDEFVILDKQPVARSPEGELIRTRVRIFKASAQGRQQAGEEDGFAFCSTSRPAIINSQPGAPPVAFFLAPDDDAPAYEQRSSTNFFALYFALCHGLEAGKAAVRDRAGTARSLGYQAAARRSRTTTLKDVGDILGR
jgi:hypothetical protein